jgi:hypothetical protein
MNALKLWRMAVTGAVACAVGAGLAYAKLPALDDAAKAKAAEAAAKKGEAAKAARAAEEKAMDRVVERYKKEKGIKTVSTAEPKKKK